MNNRSLLIFTIIAAVICGVAFWYLQTTPPPPPLPDVVLPAPTAPEPQKVVTRSNPPAVPPAPTSAPARETVPMPTVQPEATPAIAAWEYKIDHLLKANPDSSEAANTATAQALLSLLPTLPVEGQVEALQHVTNLLLDKDYNRLLPILKNPAAPEEVLDVLFTDLMNREDSAKLPAILEVAKIPTHPHREEALADLQIFLDADHGGDWQKWDAAVKGYLQTQAAEEAAAAQSTAP